MMVCEKCWADAHIRAYVHGGPQVEWYRKLIDQRKNTPCPPCQQRGDCPSYGHQEECPLSRKASDD